MCAWSRIDRENVSNHILFTFIRNKPTVEHCFASYKTKMSLEVLPFEVMKVFHGFKN